MEIRDVVIVAAVRSAVARGKKDGSLAATHPIDLSAAVMKDAVGRLANTGFTAAMLDDVLWGCAMPEGSQGLNHARLAVLRAGFPVEVSAATVNRFCSSGLTERISRPAPAPDDRERPGCVPRRGHGPTGCRRASHIRGEMRHPAQRYPVGTLRASPKQ